MMDEPSTRGAAAGPAPGDTVACSPCGADVLASRPAPTLGRVLWLSSLVAIGGASFLGAHQRLGTAFRPVQIVGVIVILIYLFPWFVEAVEIRCRACGTLRLVKRGDGSLLPPLWLVLVPCFAYYIMLLVLTWTIEPS